MEKLNLIVKMKFGSHLYGTNSENSDLDFKGIFLPSEREILLNKVPKQYNFSTKKSGGKNTNEDIDNEIFSLHYFIQLACEGQTVAMDMLHAPENMFEYSNFIWRTIQENRSKFYTKNLTAFIGYARRQAARYGIRGSRLNTVREILDILGQKYPTEKLQEFWDELPELEHTHKKEKDKNGIDLYEVCGKKFQKTVQSQYVFESLSKFEQEYGQRAIQAANNQGIDWKAVSHAVRAALQIKELLTDNTITFPLKEAELVKKIKYGKMDYLTEVAPYLEDLMDEVEDLKNKSKLPEKPDRNFWDEFIMNVIKDNVISDNIIEGEDEL